MNEKLRLWGRKTKFAWGLVIVGALLLAAGAVQLTNGTTSALVVVGPLLFWGGVLFRIWLQVIKPKDES